MHRSVTWGKEDQAMMRATSRSASPRRRSSDSVRSGRSDRSSAFSDRPDSPDSTNGLVQQLDATRIGQRPKRKAAVRCMANMREEIQNRPDLWEPTTSSDEDDDFEPSYVDSDFDPGSDTDSGSNEFY